MRAHEKITALRAAGYRVAVTHLRRVRLEDGTEDLLSEAALREWSMEGETRAEDRDGGAPTRTAARLPQGGATTVLVYDAGERIVASGSAVARPDENYSRRLGVEIALGRALKYANILTTTTKE